MNDRPEEAVQGPDGVYRYADGSPRDTCEPERPDAGKRPAHIEPYIWDFICTVYPDMPHLAVASFNERRTLEEATEIITGLRAALTREADEPSEAAVRAAARLLHDEAAEAYGNGLDADAVMDCVFERLGEALRAAYAVDRAPAGAARQRLEPLPTEAMPTDREWTNLEWVLNQWHMANEDAEHYKTECERLRAAAGDALREAWATISTRLHFNVDAISGEADFQKIKASLAALNRALAAPEAG